MADQEAGAGLEAEQDWDPQSPHLVASVCQLGLISQDSATSPTNTTSLGPSIQTRAL